MLTDMIFISHSSQDKPFVRRLAADLKAKGFRVWLDEKEIAVGQSIPQSIDDAISEARYILIILSKHSVLSPWVKRELNSALPAVVKGEKVCLPAVIDDVEPPTLIGDIKYADFRRSYDEGLSSLLTGLPQRLVAEAQAREQELKALSQSYLGLGKEERRKRILEHSAFGPMQDILYNLETLEAYLYVEQLPELRDLITRQIASNEKEFPHSTWSQKAWR